MPVSDPDVSRPRLIRDSSFLEAERREIALRRGRISAREVYGQVNACSWSDPDSRLHSLLACPGDLTPGRRAGHPFDTTLLRHLSPIEWKNVILYGESKIDPVKLNRCNP